MTTEKIESDFLNKYGYLQNHGMQYNGIFGRGIAKHHSIIVPFVFDHRALPKTFAGIKLQVSIINFPAEYFPEPKNDKEPLFEYYSPERYKKFVKDNFDSIRQKLNLLSSAEEEILDALARGSFQDHIEWCELKRAEFEE